MVCFWAVERLCQSCGRLVERPCQASGQLSCAPRPVRQAAPPLPAPTIEPMHTFYRPLLAAGLMLSLAAPAWSQGQAPRLVEPSVQPGPGNQTIERIRTEDAGNRIDEVRVGGQTQSISVQPKNDMPAYEIRPADPQGGPNAGKRMWNFIKF